MKVLVALSAVLAICAGSAIPLVPGDNSHYVEGESRYIWMPDGDGVPHLVDLEKPADLAILNKLTRNGANNQYWLYTRRNPTTPQFIVNGNANSVWNSNFNSNAPTKVIVHGWTSNGNSEVNPTVTSAFLAAGDFNVIVVDWNALAGAEYPTAVAGVPGVGQQLGNFLVWLINLTNGNWDHLHLTGYSLGAHVVANAGRQTGGRPGRITGLDPAGPLWETNSNAISQNAGVYVENIHTDGGILGIFTPSGNSDFYPNGGRNSQPGCSDSGCSHDRAFQLFASSIRTNHLQGRQCLNLSQAENNQCTGAVLHMGNSILNKRGSGIYGLQTSTAWPF